MPYRQRPRQPQRSQAPRQSIQYGQNGSRQNTPQCKPSPPALMIPPANTITKRSRALLTTTKGTGTFVVVFDANGRPSRAMRLNLNCSLNISISAYPQQIFVSRSAYEAASFHRSQRHRHSRHTHRDALPYRHHALFPWYHLALRFMRNGRRRLACHLALLYLSRRVLRRWNSHRKLAVKVATARSDRRMLPLFLPWTSDAKLSNRRPATRLHRPRLRLRTKHR